MASTPDDVALSLSTLGELWPDKLRSVADQPERGAGMVAPVIEVGRLLASCRRCTNFDKVLHRLRHGERSACAELVLVDGLLRLEYFPSFEAPLRGSVLDATCVVDGLPVYFEVVAPEESDKAADRAKMVRELQDLLRSNLSGCRVEVELFEAAKCDPPRILDAVQAAEVSTWTEVADMARIRRIDSGQQLLPVFDGSGTQIILGDGATIQDASTGVVTRWESADQRAKRIFNDEYEHFSEGVPNVLVINMSAVGSEWRTWPQQIGRLFQLDRNRNVGAAAFFRQGILAKVGVPEAIRRDWNTIVNPYARVAVPEILLRGMKSLDDASWLDDPSATS